MDESHDDFMESHADFMVRFSRMSSAGYKPVGIENPRSSSAGKAAAVGGLDGRRSQKNDVLVLLAQGKRDSEIADELGIAEDTVRTLRISRM